MRARAAVIALAALAALSGCTGGSAEESKPSKPPKRTVFLKEVKKARISSWDDGGPSDKQLLKYPPRWCRELNKGYSLSRLLDASNEETYPVGWDWGTGINEAAELVVIAASVYCPKVKERVAQEARDEGWM